MTQTQRNLSKSPEVSFRLAVKSGRHFAVPSLTRQSACFLSGMHLAEWSCVAERGAQCEAFSVCAKGEAISKSTLISAILMVGITIPTGNWPETADTFWAETHAGASFATPGDGSFFGSSPVSSQVSVQGSCPFPCPNDCFVMATGQAPAVAGPSLDGNRGSSRVAVTRWRVRSEAGDRCTACG